MGKRDALAKFREADELYRTKEYERALVVLNELDEKYPNQKNVLFPKARCLYQLRRLNEALEICRELIVHHGYAKAVSLEKRIKQSMSGAHTIALRPGGDNWENVELPKLDEDENINTSLEALHADLSKDNVGEEDRPVVPEKKWPKYIAIGAGVLFLALFLALPLIAPGERESTTAASTEAMPALGLTIDLRPVVFGYTLTFQGWFVLSIISGWFSYCANLYMTLMLSGRLPGGLDGDAMLDIGVTSLCGIVLNYTCFGFFIALVMLHNKYDFAFPEFMILFVCSIITGLVLMGPYIALYFYVFSSFA